MEPMIGIDFGTSNSVVCEWRDGQARVLPNELGEGTTPSVVTLDDDGSLLFGKPARERFQPDRSVRSIKRVLGTEAVVTLGEQQLRAEAIAASLFTRLKQEAERRLHAPVQHAVITVPANSKGLQRTATRVCAGMAGLATLTLLNEPTAAAMAYGVDLREEQRILVYDFGGGTFDVTLLHVHHGLFEELASKGVRLLGGDDIDQALVELVRARIEGVSAAELADPENVYWAQRLALACEEAKIGLSQRERVTIRLPGFLGRLNVQETLTREELEAVARPFFAQTTGPIDDVLCSAGLLPKDLDRVLLVGGTSKMPLAAEIVGAHLGREVTLTPNVDPLTCVAQGAAIAAGIILQAPDLADRDYLVRLEHSLCATVLDDFTGKVVLDPIIPRGTSIPTRAAKTYEPVLDFQPEVQVEIFEGDVYDQVDHPDNAHLLHLRIPIHPPRRVEDASLEARMAYGEDGILTVEIVDVTQGKVLTSESVTFAAAMLDEQEQQQLAAHLKALMGPSAGPEESSPQ